MLTVLIRTTIVYFLLIFAMRLMGKRQIGELEVSDLVTTLLISEIASLPITEPEIPLSHAVIPMTLLLSFEVLISFLVSRFPQLKFFTARPSTLIRNGKISQKAMQNARISFDELFCELRNQGVYDLDEIEYAILEQNGHITVIQKARFRQPSAEDLGLKVEEKGLFHIIIEHGRINRHGIDLLGIRENDLRRELQKKKLEVSDVYLMTVNDAGKRTVIPRENIK
jgi:uncharacterized membrane protein YcaP (DUF421 family)